MKAARPYVVRSHRNVLARLSWCLAGAALAIGLALSVVGPPHAPFLLASLGGTTVFLFGLTRAPAAQPRALFGGHLGSASIGIACGQYLGTTPLSYSLAIAITLGFMLATRTVHPPAGANPILMVHSQAGWSALIDPVLVGLAVLVGVAAVWSRIYPGLMPYPTNPWAPSPPTITWGGWHDTHT